VLKAEAVFVDLRAEEAKQGLRWKGVIVIAISWLSLLRLLNQLGPDGIKKL
jgi:hypothetical protein